MKTFNKLSQILAIVSGAVALAFFFIPSFAVASLDSEVGMTAAKLAFGGSLELGGQSYELARSAQILFCMILNILGVVFSVLTFKYKGMRYAAPAVTLVSAVYMLVKALGSVYKFVDFRAKLPGLPNGTAAAFNYTTVIVITVALFVAVAFGVAHLLIADYLEVAGTKKLTLPKKIIAFLRDYKSEAKKIVWPNFKTVIKNTVIVLIICALIGGFVCLLDLGLAKLVELIIGQHA